MRTAFDYRCCGDQLPSRTSGIDRARHAASLVAPGRRPYPHHPGFLPAAISLALCPSAHCVLLLVVGVVVVVGLVVVVDVVVVLI